MKLACLFSGGKDSAYALFLAQQEHDVCALITIESENKESFMFHTPNITITQLQAQALDIPIITVTTKGDKEEELRDLAKAMQEAKNQYKIEGIVTGAVGSVYQATRIQQMCADENLYCFNPLWQKDQVELLNELIQDNFTVKIAGIAAYPFDDTWLGKQITQETIQQLVNMQREFKINPAGEGGEIETIVLDGPNFKKQIQTTKTTTVYENHAGVWHIEHAQVIQK